MMNVQKMEINEYYVFDITIFLYSFRKTDMDMRIRPWLYISTY